MTIKKEIILVGTYHFEQDEELIKEKKEEVIELVDYLSKYNPTKVALEWEKEQEQELNEAYANSNGTYSIDEIQQIGFRLARKLQHEQVYAVNWVGQITQDDLLKLNHAIQNSYPEIVKLMSTTSSNELSMDTKLSSSFQDLNDDKTNKHLENLYLSFVGVDDTNGEKIGFTFLHKWLEREFMIFRNIVSLSERAHERILLIIGGDHLWMLKTLFEGNGWNVINPFSNDDPEINRLGAFT